MVLILQIKTRTPTHRTG